VSAIDELSAKLGPDRFASWKWFVSVAPAEHHERHAEALLDVLAGRPVRVTEQEVSVGIRFPSQVIVAADQLAPFLKKGMRIEALDIDDATRNANRTLIDKILEGCLPVRG
jgi:hypothetical protein